MNQLNKIVDIKSLIEQKEIGEQFANILLNKFSDVEVDIYLAIEILKMDYLEVQEFYCRKYSSIEIDEIVNKVNSELDCDESDEFDSNMLGVADSTSKKRKTYYYGDDPRFVRK